MYTRPKVTETHRLSPYAPAYVLTPSQAHAAARCQPLNPQTPRTS